MRRHTQFRAYAGWSLVLLAVAAGMLLGGRTAAGTESQDSGAGFTAAQAEEVYARDCSTCHGGAGQGAMVPGTDRAAPALAGREDVTAAYVDLTLRTGRMPPPGDPFDNRAREVRYSDAERSSLVAWMIEQFSLEGDIPQVEEGDVAVGFESYALNCAHCHGSTGAGGVAGAGAYTPQVNNRDPVAIVEAIRVGPFEMPAFSADVISDEEAAGVAAFLEEVHAEQGTPLFGLVELNPVFAAAFVGLMAIATIFSLMYIGGRPSEFEIVRGRRDFAAVGKQEVAETAEHEDEHPAGGDG